MDVQDNLELGFVISIFLSFLITLLVCLRVPDCQSVHLWWRFYTDLGGYLLIRLQKLAILSQIRITCILKGTSNAHFPQVLEGLHEMSLTYFG